MKLMISMEMGVCEGQLEASLQDYLEALIFEVAGLCGESLSSSYAFSPRWRS